MARSPSQMADTLGGIGRLTELRQRLLFVLVALIIYRIGTFIPVPGVNPQALLQFMKAGKPETAVPSTVHCDHLIQARSGADEDVEAAIDRNREVYDFLQDGLAACRAAGTAVLGGDTNVSAHPQYGGTAIGLRDAAPWLRATTLDWIDPAQAQHTEFRSERFVAAVDWRPRIVLSAVGWQVPVVAMLPAGEPGCPDAEVVAVGIVESVWIGAEHGLLLWWTSM